MYLGRKYPGMQSYDYDEYAKASHQQAAEELNLREPYFGIEEKKKTGSNRSSPTKARSQYQRTQALQLKMNQ